jgi:hypothetical protein
MPGDRTECWEGTASLRRLGSIVPAHHVDQSLNGGQPDHSPETGEPATSAMDLAYQGASGTIRRRRLDEHTPGRVESEPIAQSRRSTRTPTAERTPSIRRHAAYDQGD